MGFTGDGELLRLGELPRLVKARLCGWGPQRLLIITNSAASIARLSMGLWGKFIALTGLYLYGL